MIGLLRILVKNEESEAESFVLCIEVTVESVEGDSDMSGRRECLSLRIAIFLPHLR